MSGGVQAMPSGRRRRHRRGPARRPLRRSRPARLPPAGSVIRAFVPGADTRRRCVDARRPCSRIWSCTHPDGFFEGVVHGRTGRFAYRLRAANTGGSVGRSAIPTPSARCSARSTTTCWSRARTAGSTNGSARISSTHEGVAGVHFAVWAPHARRVSVVGDFNAWDGRRHPMRKRVDSGIWEIFAPGVGEGAVYKYEIVGAGRHAAAAEGRPVRLRQRAAALDRLGRGAGPTASPGPTRAHLRSPRDGGRPPRADVDLRGASRLLAARRRIAASSPMTSWPMR